MKWRLRIGNSTSGSTSAPKERSAFYALTPGGWRDYLTLLHLPYTVWHLSYVVLGFALAPTVRYGRLGPTLGAFFLAMAISAHAMDELAGHPLRTRIPGNVLKGLAILGLMGAVALGITGVVLATTWLLPFIMFGVFIAPAYNLEWFHGRFHSDFWFAFAWGAFPFLTAYWVSGESLEPSAAFGAVAVFALSLAQRTLSSRVRSIRRRFRGIEGMITYNDGTTERIDESWVMAVDERALKLMAVAVAAISVAALLTRAAG
ncbi:MAG: hypothetical protein HY664_07975 [Chloroflexi bacterium]|nr:hypothetical protein [Chloroflexota bacterium]